MADYNEYGRAELLRACQAKGRLEDDAVSGVDLSGVPLDGLSVLRSTLKNASFARCRLEGSVWQRALLLGASLRQAGLRRATIEDSKLYGSDLIEADLEEAVVSGTRFE